MIIEIILFFSVFLLYLIYIDRKPPNMPPGPFEIPFLGSHIPTYDENKINRLRKKYGDIVTLRTGNLRSVIIFDYETCNEVLAKPEFAARPTKLKIFSIDDQKTGGVIMSNGPQWVHDRRFFIRNLRNLGMGKSYLEGAIHEEAQALVDDILKYNGEPIERPNSFKTAALNIIWQMVSSRRYDLRSTEVNGIYNATEKLFEGVESIFLSEVFPILKYLPEFMNRLLFKKNLSASYISNMKNIVDKTIDDHEKCFDPDNPRDLIDEYLIAMKAAKTNGNDHIVRKGALRQMIADAFDAGTNTISTALFWLVFLMVKYPEVTKKAQMKMDEVVPRDRLVSLEDKLNLPYIEAYLMEIFRFTSFLIVNVDRTATEDTFINGYFIPKGTTITACIYTAHTDEKYWDAPFEFKPERFLDEEGKYRAPAKGFMMFGSGKRQCAGEVLARMEYFLFGAAILQNFDVSLPEGQKLDERIFCDAIGLRIPAPNKFVYKKRV